MIEALENNWDSETIKKEFLMITTYLEDNNKTALVLFTVL